MINVQDLFANSIANTEALLRYGFKETDKDYYYLSPFANRQFTVIIKVSKKNGKVMAGVVDTKTMKEVKEIFDDNVHEDLIELAREKYDATLLTVARNCFDDKGESLVSENIEADIRTLDELTSANTLLPLQVEAMNQECERLSNILLNNGELSEFEFRRLEQLSTLLSKAEIAVVSPSNTVSYGTEFLSSINGQTPRAFVMVYRSVPGILRSTDGEFFLTRKTPFGGAVFGKNEGEEFSFFNSEGVELSGQIIEIMNPDINNNYSEKSLGAKTYNN